MPETSSNWNCDCLASSLRLSAVSLQTKTKANTKGIHVSFGGAITSWNPGGSQSHRRSALLDLNKVDVSKEIKADIGETEKNLNRLFASAERAGGLLFLMRQTRCLVSVEKLRIRMTDILLQNHVWAEVANSAKPCDVAVKDVRCIGRVQFLGFFSRNEKKRLSIHSKPMLQKPFLKR